MGSRIVAATIVTAGIVALLWVAFAGGTASDSAADSISVSSTSSAPGEADPGSDAARSTDSTDSAAPVADSDEATQKDAATAAEDENAPAPVALPDGLENQGPRMDLVDIDGWLNTDATSIDDFNGQVVLVEMWTFGCHNCKARIPFNQSYYEEFADENFEIVGVHAPEFSYEGDIDNIKNALVDLGVTWPVALDSEKLNFRAWQPGRRNFWPRTYVIDQNGEIRYDHIGEGRYEELREVIRYLLENPPAPKTTP